jgi:hypothetical protein
MGGKRCAAGEELFSAASQCAPAACGLRLLANEFGFAHRAIYWVQAHQNDRSEIPFFDLISVIAQQHWENLPQVRPQSEFFLRRPKNSCE